MRDAFDKLRILSHFLAAAYDNWRTEVWSRDLDQRYCCDGRECCCGAMTVREVYFGSLETVTSNE